MIAVSGGVSSSRIIPVAALGDATMYPDDAVTVRTTLLSASMEHGFEVMSSRICLPTASSRRCFSKGFGTPEPVRGKQPECAR